MTVSETNREILDRLRASVTAFTHGEADLDFLQAALQSAMGLLENDGSGAEKAVRLAEADVEEIRFTRLLDEQRPAVIFRLDELLEQLPG